MSGAGSAPPLSAEVQVRLARERTVWLATLRGDGTPHVTPVWFLFDAGTWWIASGDRNVKVRNVLADPRVSLALPDGEAPVVAEGRVRVHRGGFPDRITRGFALKYDGWDVRDPAQPGGGRVLLEVPVGRWLLTGGAPGPVR